MELNAWRKAVQLIKNGCPSSTVANKLSTDASDKDGGARYGNQKFFKGIGIGATSSTAKELRTLITALRRIKVTKGVNIWLDSAPGVQTIKKGFSKSPECNKLLKVLKPLLQECRANVSFIAGSANKADGASRQLNDSIASKKASYKESYRLQRQKFFNSTK